MDLDSFLEHYGKKGMKWGRRTKTPQLGPSKDAKRASSAFKKAKTSGVKVLSNKELSDLNNRLGLEQRYSQLNPTVAQKGRKAIKGILATGAALNTAVAFAKSPAGKAIASNFTKKVS